MKRLRSMPMARTVEIGIHDFGKIIESNCFYTDKTAFIKEWWESRDDLFAFKVSKTAIQKEKLTQNIDF